MGATSDPRQPLYLGFWHRAIANVSKEPATDNYDEPHIKRRLAILEAHPEITSLYGIDVSTKYITLFAVACQVALAYVFGNYVSNNWIMLATAYVVGASFTSLFGVLIHEASHGLCAESMLVNRAVGLLANVGIVFPIFASFRRYHLEHHAYQGVFGKDPDLPLQWEYKLLHANPVTKILFLFFYPMMYVVRGAAMGKAPSFWEYVNWAWTISTDLLILKFCGLRGLTYLFLSLWLGYGIHVGAAHFIQEHFTFVDGQETYSYYGGLNKVLLNIGYHNEHHDFTKVPWSKLPDIKRIAPEFYDPLVAHYSWFKVIYDFIFDPTIGPVSRVQRDFEDHKKGRKLVRKVIESVQEGSKDEIREKLD